MGDNYGVSFAHKLNEEGRYDEAIVSAEKEIARDGGDPEPLVDRAIALSALERFTEAARDLERALSLDVDAQVLETDFVDDALFGALLGEARKNAARDLSGALTTLSRYASILPNGRHRSDVDVWSARLRGEGSDAVIIKERQV
jgi:tetratricopeptide (TPR) repeat protein